MATRDACADTGCICLVCADLVIPVRKAPHPRARSVRLTVGAQGARVSYPWGMAEARVLAFLQAHRDWLREQYRVLQLDLVLPPLHVGTPLAIFWRGGEGRVTWQHGDYPCVTRHAAGLCIQLPQPCRQPLRRACRLIAAALEAALRGDVAGWLATSVAGVGRAPSAIIVRAMKSQWGSCDARGRIRLDLALALAPASVLRYVLVHELCHLVQRNHSRAFWQAVEVLCPAWRDERRWLAVHGARLKTELNRLTVPAAAPESD